MAEIYKFFNSGIGDSRMYEASDFADYFGSVLSTGLLHTDEVPGMRVSVEVGTLNTIVSTGKAIMKGHLYENTLPLTLAHAIPEPSMNRIDRVVLRLNLQNAERNIKLHVIQGEPGANPVAPTLQRDNFIHEISLAQVVVRANTVQLLQSDLIDERLDEVVCGLVYSLISIPTSQFQDQWDDFIAGVEGSGFVNNNVFDIHTAGGTANAISISTGGNYFYGPLRQLKFKATASNTGNVTINVDGLGAKPALKFDGTQLAAGVIKAGKVYDWYYDSANGGRFFLVAKASGTAVVGDVLAGKPFSNDDGEQIGTMPKRVGGTSATSVLPDIGGKKLFVNIPKGAYLEDTGAVVGGATKEKDSVITVNDLDFIAGNVMKNVDLFGLLGTLEPSKIATGTMTTTTSGDSYIFSVSAGFNPKVVIFYKNSQSFIIHTSPDCWTLPNLVINARIGNLSGSVGYRSFANGFYAQFIIANQDVDTGPYTYLLIG